MQTNCGEPEDVALGTARRLEAGGVPRRCLVGR